MIYLPSSWAHKNVDADGFSSSKVGSNASQNVQADTSSFYGNRTRQLSKLFHTCCQTCPRNQTERGDEVGV